MSTGTEWAALSDVLMKSKFDQKIPRVHSEMTWELITSGEMPPPGESYDDWLKCQPAYRDRLPNPAICKTADYQYEVQWSPRRGHAAVFFKGYIWVLGGRARELAELPESESIGGVIGPRVKVQSCHHFCMNFDLGYLS
jgi:hypothetical protein